MYGLSIIIPTYNEAENINGLISHIYSCVDRRDVQIIVVDAADSNDGIFEKIEESEILMLSCDFSSRAHQMDMGARHSSSDILYFLHADTLPPRTFYDDISTCLSDGKDFGMFSYRFDSEIWMLKINSRFTKSDGLFTGGGDQGLFIKKEVYESTEGFDLDLPIMEDFEFFWRLRSKGYEYAIIPHDALVSARKYEENSYLKVQWVNLVTLLAFKWGVDPNKLKQFYTKRLKKMEKNA